MNRTYGTSLFFAVSMLQLFMPRHAIGQEIVDTASRNENFNAVHIYLDCSSWLCDKDYIRQEITFVNYVRDRNEADVHILVTTQETGSGGLEFTLTCIGKRGFAGINDTLTHVSKKADTEENIRKELVKTLKLGLIRYVSRTPLAHDLSISYTAPKKGLEKVVDGWDYWVFSLSTNCYINGEQSSKYSSFYGSLSANRITASLKVQLSLYGNYSENSFEYADYSYFSASRGKGGSGLLAFSINDHWSVGGFFSVNSSTYSNTRFAASVTPAIEYDLFPYSESTRRQLRFTYRAGISHTDYETETIYDRTSENRAYEKLVVALEQKEQWGSSSISIYGSHYFHDLNKYNIGVDASVSFRLIEGLSLDLYGNYSKPHDQLGLEKSGATQEEVLLQRRELETQYRYWASIGLSYTFGSIYNNIVNPRFGGN